MPVRSDYILRLVQQLAQVVARALALRGGRRHEDALRELGEAARQFFGVDARLAVALALPDLLAFLKDKHGSTPRSALLLAELLLHDGDTRLETGDAERAQAVHQRALALADAAASLDDATEDDRAEAARLRDALRSRTASASAPDA